MSLKGAYYIPMEPKKHGGKREGSGRKQTGQKVRSFRLTDEQYETVKAFIKELRVKKPKSP